jgi:hypothetical protein
MAEDLMSKSMRDIYKEYEKLEKNIYKQRKQKNKKRKSLSSSKKIFLWENNPHKCHICGKKIAKLSDVEFDHVKPFSKGGTKIKMAHRFCNRIKSNKSLKNIKKSLGIKSD